MLKRRLMQLDHQGLAALVSVPQPVMGAPLLCFLHGHGEAMPAELFSAMSKFGPLSPGAPAAVAEGFLIVAPQLPRAGDLWHHQAEVVRSLVLQLQAEHDTDPSRCYLTGFSFGGNGVFDLALAQPGFWTALWAVDPTRVPLRSLAEPAWLSIGPCVRKHEKEFMESLQSQPPKHEPFGARIHLDEGDDHAGCAERAYADARIYDWLLEHQSQ